MGLIGGLIKGAVDMLPFIATGKKLLKPRDQNQEGTPIPKPLIGIIKRIDYSRLIGQILMFVIIMIFVLKTKEISIEYLKVILDVVSKFF